MQISTAEQTNLFYYKWSVHRKFVPRTLPVGVGVHGQGVNLGVGLGVGLVVGSPLITSLDSQGACLRSGSLMT